MPVGDEEPGYGIGAVARMLGVPAPTLRTWNLRYGIGPSRRSPGGHRRYDDTDLRRLTEMNRLIHAGMPPADAARQALRLGPRARDEAERAMPPVPDSGGAPVPGQSLMPAAMIARAAAALDGATVSRGLEAALRAHGVVWAWEHVALPVFAAICRRQEETGAGVEIEHLFTDRLMTALVTFASRAPRPVHPRPVLLACAEDEQHSLPAHALAAALSGLGAQTRVLGARTPYPALADAMRRLGPAAVFVWSQRRVTGDPAPLAALPRLRPASRIVVGGPGWWDALPRGVVRVTAFHEAITAVMTSVR
ncbi:MerR family transcriptional regulator [Microbispora sp. RL4-1S]|uniref:MerR family transcriptional regulator n=2 Tax=Microbispora oryzae TaxID=2806554 RepID=A0A940WLY3_9ACTN|nr:MerR family transcriptional regulator [Microbispora oryzae]